MTNARQRGLEAERILREGLAELARSDSELFRSLGQHLQQAQIHLDRLSDLENDTAVSNVAPTAGSLSAVAEPWTEARVKAQFGGFPAAYQWLRQTHGIKLASRAKPAILAALNTHAQNLGSEIGSATPKSAIAAKPSDRLEQRFDRLEQLVLRIALHLGVEVS